MTTTGWIGIGLAAWGLSTAGCQRNEKAPPPAMSTSKKKDAAPAGKADPKALAAQQDYAGAAKALAATLADGNGSAAAYSDLAWYAYLAGDHAAADKAVTDGLALAPAPDVKSALLYNRGRIAQATGKVPEAGIAFAEAVEMNDNPAAQYWKDLLPADGAVVTGDDATLCAALSAQVAVRHELPPGQVTCQVVDPSVLFPKIETAVLAGKAAVLSLATEGGASQLTYALWQQGNVFAVRGMLAETRGDALTRTLRRVERGEGYVALHTELTGNRRDASYLATEVTYCPDGARPCSLVLRTNFEDHAEDQTGDRADDEAQTAWSVAYDLAQNGVLTVTKKSGKPPIGLVGEHRIN